MAFPTDNGFIVALTYGPDRDWVKNVIHAGRCGLIYRGRRIRVADPVMVEGEAGMRWMPAPVRVVLRLTHVDKFLRLRQV